MLLETSGRLDNVPEEHRTCLYRLVQESLTDCIRRSAAKSVNIDLQETEGMLELPVKDDGVGFDPARARHGLGLLGIPERVRDSEGGWSRFRSRPRSFASRETTAAQNGSRMMPVLGADDHGIVRKGVRFLLERDAGIEIAAEAEDGREAVRLAGELQPHVVLIDIAMPRLNGIDAASQITKANPRTGVIIVCMYSDEEFLIRALTAGAKGYLLKDSAERTVRGRSSGRKRTNVLQPRNSRYSPRGLRPPVAAGGPAGWLRSANRA